MENTQVIQKGIKGLNGTQLKIIAAILMVFDHIHECFISTALEAPLWFTYLGRVVAPIFLYLAAEGMYYTKNRKKHLLRLYIASNLMNLGSYFLGKSFPTERFMLMNNIFATIFVGCFIIYFIDNAIKYFKEKEIVKGILSIVGILLPFITTPIIFLSEGFLGPFGLTVLPNALICEGGIPFVLLLITFYYGRKHKLICLIALSIVSALSFVLTGESFTIASLLANFQWMMIFAGIFILLYNGEKGKGYKNFFYVFYPVHIYILYVIGWFIAGGK